jgi:hypothetical protein
MPPILPENLIPGNIYIVEIEDGRQFPQEFVNLVPPMFARFKAGMIGNFVSHNVGFCRFYNPGDPFIPQPPPPAAVIPKLSIANAPYIGNKIEGKDLVIKGEKNGINLDLRILQTGTPGK